MTLEPPIAHLAQTTHRLIPSRYPPTGIFDSVASAEDLDGVVELEDWTNDRISAELGKFHMLPREDWAFGVPGASMIMAALCHPDPEGARFTDGTIGAWYAGLELDTAIAETVHHSTRRLMETGLTYVRVRMRQLAGEVAASVHDIRGHRRQPEIYDPDDYAESQRFGARLRDAGSQGIVYRSVRRSGGERVVVFIPRLVLAAVPVANFEYRWSGAREPEVVRLSDEG